MHLTKDLTIVIAVGGSILGILIILAILYCCCKRGNIGTKYKLWRRQRVERGIERRDAERNGEAKYQQTKYNDRIRSYTAGSLIYDLR